MADGIDDFLRLYYGQLMSIGLPEDLYGRVYEKIFPKLVYDAGHSFIFNELESGRGYSLCAKNDIGKFSDIFLIDHAWSNDGGSIAQKQLGKMPQLIARMQSMFALDEVDDQSDESEFLNSVDVVKDFCSCSSEKARLMLKEKKYSLIDSVMHIQHGDQSMQESNDDSTLCSFEEFKKAMQKCAPEMVEAGVSDDYFKKMYANFKQQRGKGAGAAMTSKYNWTDNIADGLVEVHVAIKPNIHKDQIKSVLKLDHWSLEVEGMDTLVSGQLFENVMPDESWWVIESAGVLSMYLKKGRSHGETWTELIKGESQLSPEEIEEAAWNNELKIAAEIKDILDEMWAHNQTYRVGSSSGKGKSPAPVWYIMDEVGTAIEHSESPNFACAPLFILGKGMAVSLIWPIRNVTVGEKITRNYVPVLFQDEERDNFDARLSTLASHFSKVSIKSKEDSQENRNENARPDITPTVVNPVSVMKSTDSKKALFCDFISEDDLLEVVSKFGCSVTKDAKQADYILAKNFSSITDASASVKANSFVGEEFLFKKSYLHSALKAHGENFSWDRKTYDLKKEFQKLQLETSAKGYDDYWVLRCDDSSEIDMPPVVTSDILRISRLIESGMRTASKFILNAPTYKGKRFTLSYIAFVTSTKPLEMHVHKEPYIREAKNKYDPLKMLDEYDSSAVLTERPSESFESKRQQDFAPFVAFIDETLKNGSANKRWKDIEQQVMERIGTVVGILCSSKVALDKSSFGLMGVDFILDADFSPVFISFDRCPIFPNANVLEDILSSLLCIDISKGLPAGNSFIRVSV